MKFARNSCIQDTCKGHTRVLKERGTLTEKWSASNDTKQHRTCKSVLSPCFQAAVRPRMALGTCHCSEPYHSTRQGRVLTASAVQKSWVWDSDCNGGIYLSLRCHHSVSHTSAANEFLSESEPTPRPLEPRHLTLPSPKGLVSMSSLLDRSSLSCRRQCFGLEF